MEKAPSNSLEYWNMRAETFGRTCGKNRYVESFIEALGLDEGESVLDMGCATGTLAIPLAKAGHPVLACDFSPKMVERLEEGASAEGVRVDAKVMAWQDDWRSFGIDDGCVDVAVASRSIAAQDLGECLEKLEKAARRMAAVTVPATPVPACDPKLCSHLGREVPWRRHDAEAFSILCERGRLPRVSYISAPRPMRFEDWDVALFELRKMAGKKPLSPEEESMLDSYARSHFVLEGEGDGARYVLDYPLSVEWAFISWDVRVNVRGD